MVAKAGIAHEFTVSAHLRGEQEDFEEPEDVMFDQDLVIKSLRSQALTFQRPLCRFPIWRPRDLGGWARQAVSQGIQ